MPPFPPPPDPTLEDTQPIAPLRLTSQWTEVAPSPLCALEELLFKLLGLIGQFEANGFIVPIQPDVLRFYQEINAEIARRDYGLDPNQRPNF